MTIWKPIEGAAWYEVSDEGGVRRIVDLRCHPPGELNPTLRNGYPFVTLIIDGKRRARYVHRLVAEAFLGEAPSPRHEVAHGDGDRRNPRADNLRWATRSENMADRYEHGTHRRGEKCPTSRLTWDQIRAIRTSDRPQSQLAREFGVHPSHISRIKSGARDTWKEMCHSN